MMSALTRRGWVRFNLLEEIDLAAKLHKVTTRDPQALSARQALEMATVLGARALGWRIASVPVRQAATALQAVGGS
jgi:cytosine/adenosine deaminase-related metal-dependent hydrolase